MDQSITPIPDSIPISLILRPEGNHEAIVVFENIPAFMRKWEAFRDYFDDMFGNEELWDTHTISYGGIQIWHQYIKNIREFADFPNLPPPESEDDLMSSWRVWMQFYAREPECKDLMHRRVVEFYHSNQDITMSELGPGDVEVPYYMWAVREFFSTQPYKQRPYIEPMMCYYSRSEMPLTAATFEKFEMCTGSDSTWSQYIKEVDPKCAEWIESTFYRFIHFESHRQYALWKSRDDWDWFKYLDAVRERGWYLLCNLFSQHYAENEEQDKVRREWIDAHPHSVSFPPHVAVMGFDAYKENIEKSEMSTLFKQLLNDLRETDIYKNFWTESPPGSVFVYEQ